ncbi:MAG: hypothetical protein JWN29_865, partial [Acidimicrobiales bacterium]|nr:hypothetical protein [Acidimicrobiales bacterium]
MTDTAMTDTATRLHDLFDRHWRHLMAEHPELATMTGWPEGHDRWTDMSVEAVERRRREVGQWLAEAEQLDPAGLDEVDRRSLEMFVAVERAAVDAAAFPDAYLALHQMEGPHLDPSFYLGVMGKDSPKELGDLLVRLRGIPDLVDQTIGVLHRGIELGITQPAICLREVPAQIELLLSDDPGTNPLLLAFADTPEEVRAEATTIVAERCVPAYRRLQEMVTGTYLPACRETTALSDLPDGREWYAERVRYHTTTDLSVEEIHEIGQAEVRRIVAEMDEV